MGKFIAVLMLARTLGHITHLSTGSYAQHIALGDFYNDIGDLLDSLCETSQYTGEVIDIPVLSYGEKPDPITFISSQLDWIMSNRFVFPKDDTCAQNIIDEIVALYRSTLFKLRRFA